MKSLFSFLITALLLCVLTGNTVYCQDQKKSDKAEEKLGSILIATTNLKRGQEFADFFKEHKIECKAVEFKDATQEVIEKHDLLIVDTDEGGNEEVIKPLGQLQAEWGEAGKKVPEEKLPYILKTDKPVLAIGAIGARYLRARKVSLASGYL